MLNQVQPESSLEEVLQNTGFELRVSPTVSLAQPPTVQELHVLRTVVKKKLERSYPEFAREKILTVSEPQE